MKMVKIKIICILGIMFFLSSNSFAGVSLPWSSSFENCPEWNDFSPINGCEWGRNTQNNIYRDADGRYHYGEILSSANHYGGSGKAHRSYWKGRNGSNALTLNFSPTTDFWFRWYMRFEKGWSKNLQDMKVVYFSHDSTNWFVFRMSSNGRLGINANYEGNPGGMSAAYESSPDASRITDGKWHCYEYHIKLGSPGKAKLEIWVDGKKVHSDGSAFFLTKFPYVSKIQLLVNAKTTDDNPNSGMYIDFDDVVISNKGYIGPIGGQVQSQPVENNQQTVVNNLSPPAKLRIMN